MEELKQIDITYKYQGYLWLSDKSTPIVCYGDKPLKEVMEDYVIKEKLMITPFESINPFIIEGQLYDDSRNISYSIKFVDGSYVIRNYKVGQMDYNNVEVEELFLYANRMENGLKLHFLQYWHSEPDVLCEKMEVMQPEKIVFVGFKR